MVDKPSDTRLDELIFPYMMANIGCQLDGIQNHMEQAPGHVCKGLLKLG